MAAGRVDEAQVDTALTRLVNIQMRLGFFDPPARVPFTAIGAESVDTSEHRALAKEAADQALVLLRNAPVGHMSSRQGVRDGLVAGNGALPLSLATVRRVAVLGPLADDGRNMLGNYEGDPKVLISPLAGIRTLVETAIPLAKEAAVLDSEAAAEAARQVQQSECDAVVLVVGLRSEAGAGRLQVESGGGRPMDEAEGQDRTSLLLPGGQATLVRHVAAAAAAKAVAPPVILVLIGGGSMDVSEFDTPASNVSAILWAGYPGQAGGAAIADAIFGRTNPSGRLTTTWHRESFVQRVEMARMWMRPDAATGHPGRSHRFFVGDAEDILYPFGHGLSYATFHATLASVLPQRATLSTLASAGAWADSRALRQEIVAECTVHVTHRGGPPGAHVVLLMARPPSGTAGAPVQSLVAFERVVLAPGERRELQLRVSALALSFARDDDDGSRILPAGRWELWLEEGEAAHGSVVWASSLVLLG